jgi:hypothetical protein
MGAVPGGQTALDASGDQRGLPSVSVCVTLASRARKGVLTIDTSASISFSGPAPAVPPCPETVQAAGLLAEIEAVIKNHVVLPDPAAAALAVWVLRTKNDVQ